MHHTEIISAFASIYSSKIRLDQHPVIWAQRKTSTEVIVHAGSLLKEGVTMAMMHWQNLLMPPSWVPLHPKSVDPSYILCVCKCICTCFGRCYAIGYMGICGRLQRVKWLIRKEHKRSAGIEHCTCTLKGKQHFCLNYSLICKWNYILILCVCVCVLCVWYCFWCVRWQVPRSDWLES